MSQLVVGILGHLLIMSNGSETVIGLGRLFSIKAYFSQIALSKFYERHTKKLKIVQVLQFVLNEQVAIYPFQAHQYLFYAVALKIDNLAQNLRVSSNVYHNMRGTIG